MLYICCTCMWSEIRKVWWCQWCPDPKPWWSQWSCWARWGSSTWSWIGTSFHSKQSAIGMFVSFLFWIWTKWKMIVFSVCSKIYPGWPEYYLNRLSTRDPGDVRKTLDHPDVASLQRLAKIMQLSSYSTVFSGIDSPGTSFAQLRVALESILDIQIHDPEHLHAVEAFTYIPIFCSCRFIKTNLFKWIHNQECINNQ